MKFAESMKSTYFTKYAVFKGRASESEYVNCFLFQLALTSLLLYLPQYQLELTPLISIVVGIITFIPGMALTSRRLHDTGHSYSVVLKPLNYLGLFFITLKLATLLPVTWFIFFVLVVSFGSLIYGGYLTINLYKKLFSKGQLEANKYGDPPIQ
jgi:hypothetical protein